MTSQIKSMAPSHTFYLYVIFKGVVMKYISSRNNENIKQIIKLKNKKYRYIEKRFIIEGQKLLDEAIKCGCLVDKLYMVEKNKARFDEYVKLLPDTENMC